MLRLELMRSADYAGLIWWGRAAEKELACFVDFLLVSSV